MEFANSENLIHLRLVNSTSFEQIHTSVDNVVHLVPVWIGDLATASPVEETEALLADGDGKTEYIDRAQPRSRYSREVDILQMAHFISSVVFFFFRGGNVSE